MTAGCSLVVLAGGRSRRMGADKATLAAGRQTLTERIIERLGAVVDEVIVAAGDNHIDPVPGRIVQDHFPGAGPLAGIHAGLRAAAFENAWVVACDYPDVDPGIGLLLVRAVSGFDAAVPLVAGRPQGVCAIYSVPLASRIERLIASGERRLGALLESSLVRYLDERELREVDPELASFRNLNTPADYQEWIRSTRARH
jgi:molybdopterin-guanine dinucleotide biosynthesis protein A